MNKLNKIYEAMLKCLGCVIKPDYAIVMSRSGQEIPVQVDDKQTYLPVTEALEVPGYDRAFFHPACESIASKETEMDKVLRKLIASSIYFNFRPIADVLFKAAASRSSKSLPPKILEDLAPLRNVDKKTITEVVDIIKRISILIEAESLDTRIVMLTLKRGGKTENDEHVFYRCTPSFPFYRELKRLMNQNTSLEKTPKETVMFGDVKCSYHAICCVCTIFELAIPSVKDPSRLETVSTNQTAARMSAMLRTFGLIAGEINTIIGKFRKEFDEIGVYGFELDWIESLDELPEIASLVPALEYNNYSTKPETVETELFLDPFNVKRVSEPVQVVEAAPAVHIKGKAIKPPQTLPGETYIGMKTHENGVIEYRFRNGNETRVVCLDENGAPLSERFISGYSDAGRRSSTGWGDEGEYEMLPNGVRVPILRRSYERDYYDDRRRRDYYDDRDRDYRDRDRRDRDRDYYERDRPRTSWGVEESDNRGGGAEGYFAFNSNF